MIEKTCEWLHCMGHEWPRARVLIVCHCERDDGEVIQIISARKATKRESAYYGGEKP